MPQATTMDPQEQPTAGRIDRLATALGQLLNRRYKLVLAVVVPTTAFTAAWHLYRLEAASLHGEMASNGTMIDIIVIGMVMIAGLLAFLLGRFSYSLDESLVPLDETGGIRTRLQKLIDENTRTQSALLEANEQLRSSTATLERWAGDLEAANARLRDLNTLKTKFVSEVGHELRAPVTAIVAAAKIIVRHHATKPEVVDRFGGTIVVEGDRLTRLLNDMLDLAKIEAGGIEWKDARVDPCELARQAIMSVEPLAVEEHISLDIETSDELPRICIDRDRVLQVLTNLLHNAIKYTPRAGNITVRVTRTDREFVFAVRDTGPGISDEDLEKVFDRFVQVQAISKDSQTARPPVPSTGLGLCISKEIVEHYRGRIWVESKVGKGSTFSFSIPERSGLEETRTRKPPTDIGPIRVLALLENDELADRARGVSATTGLECRTCKSIAELRSSLSSYLPDAVLVSASLIPESNEVLLDAVQQHGVSELLVHSHDGRIRSRAVRDSSVIAVRRLRYHVSLGDTILLVEDDERFRHIVEFELRHAGYEVLLASDGQEALKVIEKEKPDAILLDILMPHVDGLSVLEEIAAAKHKLPVLVLTAMEDDELVQAAMDLGAVEVMRKDGIGTTSSAPVFARVQRILGPLLAPEALADPADGGDPDRPPRS